MKQIRYGVFETNSSSTHSLSIIKYEKPYNEKIPSNIENYEVFEMGGVSGHEERVAKKRCRSEIDKLRMIVNIIATYIEDHEDRYGFKCEYGENYNETEQSKNRRNFDAVISTSPFVWLKQLIKEKTRTDIVYMQGNGYFPFFDLYYPENTDIHRLFDCNWDDEISFKEFMHDIIFNEEIELEYKDVPYGWEEDE